MTALLKLVTNLELSYCEHIRDSAVSLLLAELPIESLNLEACRLLEVVDIFDPPDELQTLWEPMSRNLLPRDGNASSTYLSLNACRRVHDVGLIESFARLTSLTTLELAGIGLERLAK
jgi:hypothetical protein